VYNSKDRVAFEAMAVKKNVSIQRLTYFSSATALERFNKDAQKRRLGWLEAKMRQIKSVIFIQPTHYPDES